MNFWKMNANGSNYIILNNLEETLPEALFPALVKELCLPHQSLGADGCLVVDEAQGAADFRVLIYNHDGTEEQLSASNGSCICRYGFETGLCGFSPTIETVEGVVTGQRLSKQRYSVCKEDGHPLTATTKLVAKGEIFDEDLPALFWLLSGALCAE